MKHFGKNLEALTGADIQSISAESIIAITTKEAAAEVLSEAELIEKNKDKLDLKPAVDFVEKHLATYQVGLTKLLAAEPTENSKKLAESVKYSGEDEMVEPQLSPKECAELLAVMPESLVELSMLEDVSYHTFGLPKVIPVPGYDDEGNFDSRKVKLVPVSDFPREKDHPTRILVGVSNGLTIFPTPIPATVSKNAEAVKMYQLHVFLHEFFHTIDYKRRDNGERAKVKLEVDGMQFSLQDWWEAFEQLLVSGLEPGAVSSYAETYNHHLNTEFANKDVAKFTTAVGEQICETFVAYMLGIVSNNQGWTDFRAESFGNVAMLQKHLAGESKAANLKWILIDKLCRAKVISK